MIDFLKAIIEKRSGLARPNRFEVNFSLPAGISDDSGRDLTILCESSFLPAKQITTFEWSAYGHTIKIPTNFIQEDITCLFNVTNDYYVKEIFDLWQNKIIDNKKFQINYDSEFKRDISLRQLDEKDKAVYEYVLQGAYPLSVGQLILDNNASDQVQKLSVTFCYNDFIQRKL